MEINNSELFEFIAEIGEYEDGGRIKHDMNECTITLHVHKAIRDGYGDSLKACLENCFYTSDLNELNNHVFEIHGYTTYNDGFDSYDKTIYVYKKVIHPLVKEFNQLFNCTTKDQAFFKNKLVKHLGTYYEKCTPYQNDQKTD